MRFYSALGLRFIRERHTNGREHYVCQLGSMLLELYPSSQLPPGEPAVGLGFRVASVDDAVIAAQKEGGEIAKGPHDSAWGRRAVLRDPDGYAVELLQLPR